MTTTFEPTDALLRRAVEASIASILGEEAAHIGVAADDGTITLCGEITDLEQRDRVVAAALKVDGVRAIADGMTTHDSSRLIDTDTELAAAAQRALHRCEGLQRGAVVAEVRERVLTLAGEVDSTSERVAAERAVLSLPGLVRIKNRITVHPSS